MLEGKTAIVTGASGGIGRAIVLGLAKEGAAVAIHYHGNKEKAEAVRQEIEELGAKAEIFCCDVSDFAQCESFVKEVIKTFGRVDILINNAGITKDGLVMGMKEADFDAVINTNLKGSFNCIRFVSRQMMKQRYGRIINLSSVVGIFGNAGQVNYAASKAGIIGMTKSAARELGSRGITVNAIAPGFIQTDMTDSLSDDMKNQMLGAISLGSFGKVEDIAYTAAFLASDRARYITGQVIQVDGGIRM